MSKQFSPQQKETARKDYLAGDSSTDIARKLGCSRRTITNWVRSGDWQAALKKRRQSPQWLEDQIGRLSRGNMTEGKARKIAMLSNALARLRKTAPQPTARPTIKHAHHAELLRRVLHQDYGLYAYQKRAISNTDRFRCWLKSRQIGFSYTLALDALLRCAGGRDQLIVSASQDQSDILINYAIDHAARLGVELATANNSELRIGNHIIKAKPANQRTIQGWAGDVILDEFAWQQNQKRIWRAIIPSITAVGGSVTVCSTPFMPGTLFWEIATNLKGRWNHYSRETITIHDALAEGMALPGGIDELRQNFDAESWAIMFECQWAEDGHALLSWEIIDQAATGNASKKEGRGMPAWVGIDVGRSNDKTAIAIIVAQQDKWRLLRLEELSGKTFAEQKSELLRICKPYDIKRMQIDRTGIGMQLAEELCLHFQGTGWGINFTNQSKQRMALNLLNLFEKRDISIPRDPNIMRQLHAVKKMATPSGNAIKYDAARDETGHADAFWAVALAADGLAQGYTGGCTIEIW